MWSQTVSVSILCHPLELDFDSIDSFESPDRTSSELGRRLCCIFLPSLFSSNFSNCCPRPTGSERERDPLCLSVRFFIGKRVSPLSSSLGSSLPLGQLKAELIQASLSHFLALSTYSLYPFFVLFSQKKKRSGLGSCRWPSIMSFATIGCCCLSPK